MQEVSYDIIVGAIALGLMILIIGLFKSDLHFVHNSTKRESQIEKKSEIEIKGFDEEKIATYNPDVSKDEAKKYNTRQILSMINWYEADKDWQGAKKATLKIVTDATTDSGDQYQLDDTTQVNTVKSKFAIEESKLYPVTKYIDADGNITIRVYQQADVIDIN